MNDWQAYEEAYGPLATGERIDAGFALLAMLLARTLGGGNQRVIDFMPMWYRELTAADRTRAWFEGMLRLADANDQ